MPKPSVIVGCNYGREGVSLPNIALFIAVGAMMGF